MVNPKKKKSERLRAPRAALPGRTPHVVRRHRGKGAEAEPAVHAAEVLPMTSS